MFRRGQDSNLCGETPFDFESNALTTRPPRPPVLAKRRRGAMFCGAISQLFKFQISKFTYYSGLIIPILKYLEINAIFQWRIQDPLEECAVRLRREKRAPTYYLVKSLSQNFIKMREIQPRGEGPHL